MPVTYSTDQTVRPAIFVKTNRLVGVLINMEDNTVTWKFKAYDAAGKLTTEGEFSEPFSQIQAEAPADFKEAYAKTKAHGYLHYADAGMPAGGTVT